MNYLKKWPVWVALVGITVVVFVVLNGSGEHERRPYMTLEEYNNIDIGMTFEELKNVQLAKPAGDAEEIVEGYFAISYDGEETASYAQILLKKEGDDIKDYVVVDKNAFGLN